MNFIKNNYKSILKYLGIYLFVCICYIYIFYFLKFGDSLTFYSFSHALKNGQVIYNDFNIITTPLYVIFMSYLISLKISSSDNSPSPIIVFTSSVKDLLKALYVFMFMYIDIVKISS